ncbi:MAG: hypothetical protein ACI9OJ_000859 [Myxococcota bacterium]|jgi:hypothetical protein
MPGKPDGAVLHKECPSESFPQSALLLLTFGPGVIRYLDVRLLAHGGLDRVLRQIEELPGDPVMDWGIQDPRLFHKDHWSQSGRSRKTRIPAEASELRLIDILPGIPGPYRELLPEVARVVDSYAAQPFPSYAYLAFRDLMGVERLVMDEFLESWVGIDAQNDQDRARSFEGSPEHIVVHHDCYRGDIHVDTRPYVFHRTPFVAARLAEEEEREARQQEERTAQADQEFDERLCRSSFETYTYLMEDLRNGLMKIGRSKTPGARERTLQSEVPEIEMRFAIPAEVTAESRLHADYAHRRVRGEWFDLQAGEVLKIVDMLLKEGDRQRVVVSEKWLGQVFLEARRIQP